MDSIVCHSPIVTANATDVMKEMVSGRPEDMTYITNNVIGIRSIAP